MRIFITGDTHSDFLPIEYFCNDNKTTKEDLMIILGDAGVNYYNGKKDDELKRYLNSFPITFLLVRGNHEMRPEHITNNIIKFYNNEVLLDNIASNIMYAQDGSILTLNDKTFFVCGGAYSVDKYYRQLRGWNWFEDEQLSESEKEIIYNNVPSSVDYVLTHTCPESDIPFECFLDFIDQSTVDNGTEVFLETIKQKIEFKKWYCGHWHYNCDKGKIEFLFHDIKEI